MNNFPPPFPPSEVPACKQLGPLEFFFQSEFIFGFIIPCGIQGDHPLKPDPNMWTRNVYAYEYLSLLDFFLQSTLVFDIVAVQTLWASGEQSSPDTPYGSLPGARKQSLRIENSPLYVEINILIDIKGMYNTSEGLITVFIENIDTFAGFSL